MLDQKIHHGGSFLIHSKAKRRPVFYLPPKLFGIVHLAFHFSFYKTIISIVGLNGIQGNRHLSAKGNSFKILAGFAVAKQRFGL